MYPSLSMYDYKDQTPQKAFYIGHFFKLNLLGRSYLFVILFIITLYIIFCYIFVFIYDVIGGISYYVFRQISYLKNFISLVFGFGANLQKLRNPANAPTHQFSVGTSVNSLRTLFARAFRSLIYRIT